MLVLLDAHAILHRAFHALPAFTSASGEPTGAVYGFVSMLIKIIRELKPEYLAACYDLPEPTFRHAAYEQYKATRPAMDSDLVGQIARSREVLSAFGIPMYEAPGFEADDILGTVVAQNKAHKNLRIVIASGDLDTLQLVSGERVSVYMLRKGIQDTLLYDERAVRERFGFAPAALPDFKGLKGDPSDNIIGVPGIGDKTATTLIAHFGSLERIYKEIRKGAAMLEKAGISKRIVRILSEHEEDAYFSRELATIRTDAPVRFELSQSVWKGAENRARVEAIFDQLNFRNMLQRVEFRKPESDNTSRAQEEEGSAGIDIVRADQGGVALLEKDASRLWFVDEGDTQVVGAITEKSNGKAVAVLFDRETLSDFRDVLERLLLKPEQNFAFGAKRLYQVFWTCKISPAFFADLWIAGWLIGSGVSSQEAVLRALFPEQSELFGTVPIARRMAILFTRRDEVFASLRAQELERVFFDIEMPLIPVLAAMERHGILLDVPYLNKLAKKHRQELSLISQKIQKLAGASFNINSPQQLGAVLFETLELSGKGRKTKGGARSTRFSELAKLKDQHAIVPLILRHRELSKLMSTYIEKLPGLAEKDGRIHTEFQQTGTVTGRLSSTDPNLQNIPIRTAEGNEIRNAFYAPEGWCLLACDYSQIELRIAALLSGDHTMRAAFVEGKDIHTATAALVFSVAESAVTYEMRRRAKIINFGILYGMGANALAANLGVPRQEAALFIEEYFNKFAGVKKFVEETKARARKDGFVQTLFGRKRYLPEIHSPLIMRAREAERMAINMPVQGTAADIIKIAMSRIHHSLEKEWKNRANLLLQIHDELLLEVRVDILDEVASCVAALMKDVHVGEVPFAVTVKQGKRWGSLEKKDDTARTEKT